MLVPTSGSEVFLPSAKPHGMILAYFLGLRLCVGTLQSIVVQIFTNWELRFGIEVPSCAFELSKGDDEVKRKKSFTGNVNIISVLMGAFIVVVAGLVKGIVDLSVA